MLLAGTSGTHSVCVCTLHQNVTDAGGCIKVMLISDHENGRFRNGYNSAKVVVTYIRPVPCNPLQLSIFLLVTHPSICCALPIVFSF